MRAVIVFRLTILITKIFLMLILLLITTMNQCILAQDIEIDEHCYKAFNAGEKAEQMSEYQTAIKEYMNARECILTLTGGKENEATAAMLNDVALVYDSLRDYEHALEYYEKTLSVQLALTGRNHLITSDIYYNIGFVFRSKGDYKKALEYYSKSLQIKLLILGEEHSKTADSYSAIGSVYNELGKYKHALENHKKALRIRSKMLGSEHYDTAISYNNIGLVYFVLGDNKRALEYLVKALDIKLKVLGEDHPETAITYDNMGLVYRSIENNMIALENHNKALQIKLKTIGEYNDVTAISYANIGSVYFAIDDYKHALEYFNKAQQINLTYLGTKHPDIADGYNNIGSVYSSVGEYRRALNYFEMELQIDLNTFGEHNANISNDYSRIGLTYESLGDFVSALYYLNKALQINLSVFGIEHPDIAISYINIGHVYDALGKYDRAIEYYNKALLIQVKTLGVHHTDTATTYNNIGHVYYALAKYDRALDHYNYALSIQVKTLGEHHTDIATTHNNIGLVYDALAKYDRALVNYNKALEIDLTILGEEHNDTATTYNNIGLVYVSLSNYAPALMYLNKALHISKIVFGEEHPNTAKCYNNIGAAYQNIGDYNIALDNYNKAIQIELKILGEDHPDTAMIYSNIGGIYLFLGDYERSLEYRNKTLDIYLKIYGENHIVTAKSYNNLGSIYEAMSDYKHALDYYNKALQIQMKILGEGHIDTATYLNNIAGVYYSVSKYDIALNYFIKALKVKLKSLGNEHTLVAKGYNNIAAVYYQMGNFKDAIINLNKSLASLCAGKMNPTPDNCRPEISTFAAFRYIAASEHSSGNYNSATNMYENAAEVLERLRGNMHSEESKIFHGENFYDMFPSGIGSFVALYQMTGDERVLERALMFSEKGIGRVFLEKFGRALALVNGGLPEAIIHERLLINASRQAAIDALNMEIGKPIKDQFQAARKDAYEQLQQTEDALYSFDSRLLEKYPDFMELMNPHIRSLSEIKMTVLAPGEAVLEYSLGIRATYLILVMADKIRVKKLPSAKDIESNIGLLFMQLSSKQPNEEMLRELATQLFDILIGPVKDDLSGIDKLLIVPTDSLYFLPFEVLMHDGKYLAEIYSVRYEPSLNTAYLVQSRKLKDDASEKEKRRWLGFGDPIYQTECDDRARGQNVSEDTTFILRAYKRAILKNKNSERSQTFCRLPWSGEEIKTLASMLGVDMNSDNVNLGVNASESRFKMFAPGGQRYLHIAGHSTLTSGDARQPAFVFSLNSNQGTGEDGFLTMTEVFNMKIPAEMVVLSACGTGRGEIQRGEGVDGMSRAFLFAGADSLVVSLWNVADRQTESLMVSFYKELLSGKDKETALIKAKREMISRGLPPYYWAPFVFMGSN